MKNWRQVGSLDKKETSFYLADDVPVRETDNHPVLGCVVLVFVLDDQAFTSKVVSLSLWKTSHIQFLQRSP